MKMIIYINYIISTNTTKLITFAIYKNLTLITVTPPTNKIKIVLSSKTYLFLKFPTQIQRQIYHILLRFRHKLIKNNTIGWSFSNKQLFQCILICLHPACRYYINTGLDLDNDMLLLVQVYRLKC
jgi:hypothetical protein